MPKDELLVQQIQDGIKSTKDFGKVLDRAYETPEFSTVSRKPIIQMMVHATEYLSTNVQLLLDGYLRDLK